MAPDIKRRRGISVPTLVIGHKRDMLHPFADATNLVEEIPGARFLEANSLLELRTRPGRLMPRIVEFLDEAVFDNGRNRANHA
ncbi:MAG: hypothetical protein HKN06_11720 [Gammaproteobacteria bacterium]|nr:hypothetical protein [Gammaproteobacteria bacterium]